MVGGRVRRASETRRVKLRDKSAKLTRVYYVITCTDGRTVTTAKPAALKRYSEELRSVCHSRPIRLERYDLDARHLDGLLVYGDRYFDDLHGECLREYEGPK